LRRATTGRAAGRRRGRERLLHPGRDRERLGLAELEHGALARHLRDGRTGLGKNLFPSNIAGLPTWYTIRVSRDGWVARKEEIELLVAMNPETARDDVLGLRAGAAVVYDAPLALHELREDLVFYPVAFDALVEPLTKEPKLRKLLRNMAYVGVSAGCSPSTWPEIERAIEKQFPGSPRRAT
jgi:2-oxoglutarate ferredoxin oxidoreductase subunit alpha